MSTSKYYTVILNEKPILEFEAISASLVTSTNENRCILTIETSDGEFSTFCPLGVELKCQEAFEESFEIDIGYSLADMIRSHMEDEGYSSTLIDRLLDDADIGSAYITAHVEFDGTDLEITGIDSDW